MAEEEFEIFGKYFLLTRLAFGGMAEIYLARPATASANGRILVLKRILPHVTRDPAFIRMFQSEIQISMAFNHPNLVQIHDFGQTDRQPYIAMEYIEGKNLRELSAKFARLNRSVPIPVAASIVAQAAAGLHYAHTFKNHVTGEALKIIHRDISPHNILISYEGNVKIIDFGIAKSESALADKTSTGTIKGKINYLSPEQLLATPLDARSDVFSLGTVLWELLAGRKLFHLPGRSDLEVMQMIAHCDEVVVRPSSFQPGIPNTLDEITMKALKLRPEERFQTSEEFQKALSAFIMTELTNLSYREVGKVIKDVFQTEMTEERIHLKNLNERAQQALQSEFASGPSSEEITRILSPPPAASLTQIPRPILESRISHVVPAPLPPPVVQESFYIRLTPIRALNLLLTTGIILFLGLASLENSRINPEPRTIRMAMTVPLPSPTKDQATLKLEEVQRAFAKVAITDRRPAGSPNSILLKVRLVASKGVVPTGLSINRKPLSLEHLEMTVPLDEKLTIRVLRKGASPISRTIRLRSASLQGISQFELQVPLD